MFNSIINNTYDNHRQYCICWNAAANHLSLIHILSIFVCVPLLIESMYKKIDKEIKKQGKDKLIKFVTPISNFLLKFGIDIRRKVFKSVIDNLGGALRAIISGASGLDPKAVSYTHLKACRRGKTRSDCRNCSR